MNLYHQIVDISVLVRETIQKSSLAKKNPLPNSQSRVDGKVDFSLESSFHLGLQSRDQLFYQREL